MISRLNGKIRYGSTKKFKVTPSASKIMATVFLGHSSSYNDKLSVKSQAYYANELRELHEALKSKSKS